MDMDMDVDKDDCEGEPGCEPGPQIPYGYDFSGCEGAHRREKGHKSYVRMDNTNLRSNVAETFMAGFGQAQSHAITSISSFEESLPESPSRPPPTLPIGYATSSPCVVSLADPSPLSRSPDSPTFQDSYSLSLARKTMADPATERHRNNSSWKHKVPQERGHPYALAYDTRNGGNRNETYNHSCVSKKHKHDERSHSNAEIHLHLYGRESSLPASGPSTSPSASYATQRSFRAPLLNRTPSPPSKKSHNEQVTSLPNGESKYLSTSHTTPKLQGILNLTPCEKSQPSIMRESVVTSPSISHATPGCSQNTLINSTPTPPFHRSNSSQQIKGKDRERTRSERYESLLLGCKLGFPLWRPSPRCTEGGEYIPEIGGVGVHNHGLPFNTLFNITQARDSPANRDGIPEGVDPPCVLGPRAVTIEKEYHLPRTTFIRPEGAILEQGVQTNNESSDSFTFHLSEVGGALLMVPHGGTLQRLEKTTEFKERVQLHWRQWYDFAGEQVDLDDGQVLCLVTGVERCSAWAMAAWDSMSSYAGGKLGSLELSVDNHTGGCLWAFPPARCSTQSSTIPTINGHSSPRETIFIRGFWIDGLIGGPTSWSDTPSLRGESDNSGGDSDTRDCDENAPSFGGSSSISLSSTQPSFSGGGLSGTSGQRRPDAPTVTHKTQILEFNLDFLDDDPAMITNPCRIINKFAFELIARTQPTLFNTGCAAFSHDEDWMSIVNNSDEELPQMVEIIRRICLNFKFSIEGDTIHTASLSDRDKELLEQREAPRQSQGSSITVLVVFAENDNGTASPTGGVLVSPPSAYEDSDVRQQLATCSQGTTNAHVMADPSPRLAQPFFFSDWSSVPDDPTSEVPGVPPFDVSVELPIVDSSANALVAVRRREPQSYHQFPRSHDTTLDLRSFEGLRTPPSYFPEHVHQVYSRAYYTSPVSSQPTPPIVSTYHPHQYASGSNTPFSFEYYDSPNIPRSPASEVADVGPQSVIAPHSPVIIQSTTLEVPSVPLSDANVERPIVGSMARTLVARSLRRREPKYFCDVPGCTSLGFTQEHNLEYHKRSHRDERPYQCDLCLRVFGARSDLNRHIRRGTCRPP